MASLSLTVADVRELDDGGGAGHGHLPAATGDGFTKNAFLFCYPKLTFFCPPLLPPFPSLYSEF